MTRVDFANERISFYDPDSFQYAGDGHDLDVHISQSVIETSATLDGEHEGAWLLDLGAGAVLLDGIYARREGYAEKKGGTDTVFTSDRIGILGNSLFRTFVLYLDYGNERLTVEKGEKFNQPWPRDRSGLTIGWNATRDRVEVVYVSPGTPAEKAGFETGDLLRSVNNIRVEFLDGVTAIRKMLMEEAGTRYEFVVERAGREKRLNLKLAELY